MSDLENRTTGGDASFLSGLAADAALSLRFFSRIPLPQINASDDPARFPDFTKAARAVPIAGGVLAFPAAILILALHFTALPLAIQALAAVLLCICLTGALHEDGLADVADGFFGGATREKRLEIMKDSRIGAYGAIALMAGLFARTVLLATLIERFGPLAAAASLIAVEASSRAAMVWPWYRLPAARSDGLGATCGKPEFSSVIAAIPIAGIFAVPLAFLLPFSAIAAGLLFLVLATGMMSRLAVAKIGGQTGDVLGATQQIAGIALLVGLTIVA